MMGSYGYNLVESKPHKTRTIFSLGNGYFAHTYMCFFVILSAETVRGSLENGRMKMSRKQLNNF